MGLFDLFTGGSSKGARGFEKHRARAGNKRAQNADRYDSIVTLAEMGTAEAVEALLPRFEFRVDPSIVDQEEKEIAFDGCVSVGTEAIAPVKAFLASAQEVTWPLKILEKLLTEEELVSALLALLSDFDTEYERDPKRKLQVISHLEMRRDSRIVDAVGPFVEDMNDEVRFHAVRVLFAQENVADWQERLEKRMLEEESSRVRAGIAEGFLVQSWSVTEVNRAAIRELLPAPYSLEGGNGTMQKS